MFEPLRDIFRLVLEAFLQRPNCSRNADSGVHERDVMQSQLYDVAHGLMMLATQAPAAAIISTHCV